MEWDGWDKSKNFVTKYGRRFPVRQLLNDCHKPILEFALWFDKKVQELYSTELKEFYEIQREIESLEPKLF